MIFVFIIFIQFKVKQFVFCCKSKKNMANNRMQRHFFSLFTLHFSHLFVPLHKITEKYIVKMAKELKDLTKRADNYSQWYNDLVVKADLAEQSAVRGCMVIKPYGYAIWEKMQQQLDKMFKEQDVQNAYFPLLIPKSFLSREAEHVEGFAKEAAVVTHYRLKAQDGGVVVDPAAKLEEELIIRPTSETIIWNTYKNWIQSWRDLPLKCNQWCNVMRWEMRTRPFLRTSEFLWQEGHTAHATREEAEADAQKMLHVYAKFAEEWMAVPVVQGVKSETERFAGALDTYTIEAMMQDGKALQSGTSHFLGQNFAKAFDVTYLNKENKPEYVWATSWGVSTRLIGALIMTHSDDNGLVLPPRLAPIQVVIIPIATKPEQMELVNKEVKPIIDELRSKGISVKFDDADNKRPGFKFADYELKGVPVRLVLGARDLENGTIEVMRRDTLEKETRSIEGIAQYVETLLDDIQKNIFEKARAYRDAHIYECDNYEEFKEKVKDGGFFLCHWDGTAETEAQIKEETQATIRCVPFAFEQTPGVDMVSGKPSKHRVIIARSY
jgi:prolyl-tRNA synthetase